MTRLIASWERFWFRPEPTSTVAVWRIAFGLLMTCWTTALGPDLLDFFGKDGIVASQPSSVAWGILDWFPSDGAVIVTWVVLLVASVCLTIGFHSRLASVLVFIGLLSFERRTPFIFNSGDMVIRAIAFYIMLAPTGEALSLDRWRKARDRFWEFPLRAPWALRLMQVQVSVIYLAAVWAKVQGRTWNDGTAVYYAFELVDLQRFPLPNFVTDHLILINAMTYGTLLIEFAVGVLIWNRALRPYVILAGASLHIGIDYGLMVGFFSWSMFVAYTSFIDPYWLSDRILELRDRVRRRRAERGRALAAERMPLRS